MVDWKKYVLLLYGLLLFANLLLALACLVRGLPLKRLCRLALWGNGLLFLTALVPLLVLVSRAQAAAEARLAFLATVLLLLSPLVLELLLFAALALWRMREPPPSQA